MARNFVEVCKEISRLAKENHYDELSQEIEEKIICRNNAWAALNSAVNKHVKTESKNPASVAVYAVLCDKTEEEMKNLMEQMGN